MARLEGARLGDYELVERISGRSMAEVYRARQLQEAGRDVVIKIIHPDFGEQGEFRARFLREAQVIARLSHPNILPLIDFGEREPILYLVMPLVRGGTLRDLLRSYLGPLPLAQAIPIFTQLCSAVHYAHTQGIIHRDIKPQNIFLHQGKHVLLSDFALVQPSSEARLTATGAGIGMAEYMAPEQALGRADVRSDIYSLGIVLYQMLTGAVPYSGTTPRQVMARQSNEPLPDPRTLNPNLPPHLVQVLGTALAKDPGARFQNVQTLVRSMQPSRPDARPAQEPRPSARQPDTQSQPGPRPSGWQADTLSQSGPRPSTWQAMDQSQPASRPSGWQGDMPSQSGPRTSGWPSGAQPRPEPRPSGGLSGPGASFPPQADRLPPAWAAPSSSGPFAPHAPPQRPSMPPGRTSGPYPDAHREAGAYENPPASSAFGNRPASGWNAPPSAPGAFRGPSADYERAGPPPSEGDSSENLGPFRPSGAIYPASGATYPSPGAPPYRPGFGSPGAAPASEPYQPGFGPPASAYGALPRYGPGAPPFAPDSSPPGFPEWQEEPAPQRSGTGLMVAILSITLLLVLVGGGLLVAGLNGKGPLSTISSRFASTSQAPTATATPGIPQNFLTYTNPARTFNIAYPANWKESNVPASEGSGIEFQGPDQDFLVTDGGAVTGHPDLAAADAAGCKNVNGSTPTTPKQVVIGGQNWVEEECDIINKPIHLAVESVIYKGHVYLIVYAGSRATFASSRSQYFTPMERSFKFLT